MKFNGVSWDATKESIDYINSLEFNEIFTLHNPSDYIYNEIEFYGRLTVEQEYRLFGWKLC